MSLHAIMRSLVGCGKDSKGVYVGGLLAMVLDRDLVMILRVAEGESGRDVLLVAM